MSLLPGRGGSPVVSVSTIASPFDFSRVRLMAPISGWPR